MQGRPPRRDESAWHGLGRFCSAQGLAVALVPPVVEAFVVVGLPGRAASTKGTYRSELRRLAGGPRPKAATPFPGSPAKAPYTSAEVAELWSVATSQGSARRRASALAFLALGIGAGLRPGEIAATVGDDVTCEHGRVSVEVAGRVVPVAGEHGSALARLAEEAGPGHLFRPGRGAVASKNLVNGFGPKLVAGPGAPRFSSGRARSSFICGHLANGTPLPVLLYISGIAEAGSLLRYARFVPGAPKSKAGLRQRLRSE